MCVCTDEHVGVGYREKYFSNFSEKIQKESKIFFERISTTTTTRIIFSDIERRITN